MNGQSGNQATLGEQLARSVLDLCPTASLIVDNIVDSTFITYL